MSTPQENFEEAPNVGEPRAAEITVILSRKVRLYYADIENVGRVFLAQFLEATREGMKPVEEFEDFLQKAADSSIRQLGLPLVCEATVSMVQGVQINLNIELSPLLMASSPSGLIH